MTESAGTLAWIAIAPVKSMALQFLDRAVLTPNGIPGDRAFALIDDQRRLVNGKRAGSLATIRVAHDRVVGTLAITMPDGRTIEDEVAYGAPVDAIFFGAAREARPVLGPWSDALSTWSGHPLRLVAMPPGEGPDRGPTATLVSTAALGALASAAGDDQPLDRRRFRMTFGVAGVRAFAEDSWIGRDVAVGDAVIRIRGNVGRCAVTTQDPDTGRPSWDTLGALQHSRGHLPTTEPLPFGVWAGIVRPGEVALGDRVVVDSAPADTAPEY
ncbi:MAG TPA: MOSC N-terminal beta barrel domain-containing protein [Candidatus Limnocylindrales bacterium]|jgi:uncharacterized protein